MFIGPSSPLQKAIQDESLIPVHCSSPKDLISLHRLYSESRRSCLALQLLKIRLHEYPPAGSWINLRPNLLCEEKTASKKRVNCTHSSLTDG